MTTTKVSMKDLLDSLVVEFAVETQSAILDMFGKISIDDSTGQKLDNIGELVGLARNNLDDAEYRIILKAKQAANSCSGRLSEIVNVIKLLTASTYVNIVDNNAGITVYLDGVLSTYVSQNLEAFIQNIIAEGVELSAIIAYNATNAFTFKNLTDADDPLKGFGDSVTPGSYGEFTYII